MKKAVEPPLHHWWDWSSIILLFLLLYTVASRLIITEWTSYLNLIQGFTFMGFIIGLALGYSTFSRRRARWISFFYMLFMLPLQWTKVMPPDVVLEEKLSSVAGRLLYSLSEFF